MYRPKRLAGAPAPKPPSRFRKRAEEPIEEHLEELPEDTHTLPQPSQEEVGETISPQPDNSGSRLAQQLAVPTIFSPSSRSRDS